MTEDTKIDGRRGTSLWAINSFRGDALTQFLDDLVELEQDGLQPHQCNEVKKALSKMSNRAASVPKGGFFQSSILKEFEDFETIYSEWNNHDGMDDGKMHRRVALKRLRKKRARIAEKIRKNQFVIQNELDLELVRELYSAAGSLASTFPELFKNLGGAVTRFEKRSG